jgi:hypothetical protein
LSKTEQAINRTSWYRGKLTPIEQYQSIYRGSKTQIGLPDANKLLTTEVKNPFTIFTHSLSSSYQAYA